jgi:hypothetical protein
MNFDIQRTSLLKILILASVISTLIHNVDNYLRFDLYPQPAWITPTGIVRSWVTWTIFGIAGYLLYKNQRFWLSYLCLLIYSICGLSSLAHYLYGSMHEFSSFMHVFILTDGLTGLGILGFTLWSGLVLQKHVRNVFTGV